jgi:hypothetical protein
MKKVNTPHKFAKQVLFGTLGNFPQNRNHLNQRIVKLFVAEGRKMMNYLDESHALG